MRQEEFGEMIEAIKDAEKKNEGLAATAGRATARNSIEEADDLFSQLDRFASEIEGDDARRKASIEVDDLMDDEPDRFESGGSTLAFSFAALCRRAGQSRNPLA